MANAIEDLSKLSFDKKEWITELKNKVCQNGKLELEDIQTAFDKILSEIELENIEILITDSTNTIVEKTILSIYENQNIGGLYDNKKIDFSPLFTLIYGKNGSGKSTYYKALKDAFHSNQNIKGNIYNGSSAESKAKFDFTKKREHLKLQKKGTNINSGDIETVDWIAGTQHNSKIKFCDSEVLKSSLSKKEAGWSVDRYRLGYFDILRDGVIKVEEKTTAKIASILTSYSSNLTTISNGLVSNEPNSIKTYFTINQNNSELLTTKLRELISLELAVNHTKKKETAQRKSTTSVIDFTTKIELLKSKIISLDKIVSFCQTKNILLDEIETIKIKITRLKLLKESLDFSKFEQYQLVFNPNENNDKFIELIKKITETALAFNYINYPNDIDKCFYCNQVLPEENLKLIQEIHSIVGNEVNTEIEALSNEIELFKTKIDRISFEFFDFEYKNIGEIYSVLLKTIVNIKDVHENVLKNSDLSTLKNELDDLNITTDFTINIELTELLSIIALSDKNNLKTELYLANKALGDIEQTKTKALKELNELLDLEFCFNQKELLKKILADLVNHSMYKAQTGFFSTYKTKISREKGNVEKRLIQADYLVTFNQNLDFFELPKRDKINRIFSNPDGKSKIDVNIKSGGENFAINSILSEGEAKVYSFCDWLTELKYDDNNILVFDDPITSLDQVNIHKVVEKIIELSKTHQVIVFTHNFEFYHRLVQQSLGGSPIDKGKCELCDNETETNQCIGLNKSTNSLHKCSNYYTLNSILQPGHIDREVIFITLNWEKRFEIIRKNLLNGNINEVDKHLRTSINDFFERFVLNDIKRQVYKNNDLIKEWRDMREIDEADYNSLMEVHNKISGEGTVHEPSPEVRTTLDVQGYIKEFNKVVKAINNIRSYRNSTPPKAIEEIYLS
ncbi:AAA family ATPase [Flavobacterium sp. BBQ-18]|uniref:AAA family ATPase n=1 Tax=Flavobacterium undicola TaxID=1932779 RepID=UPI001377CF28|nr:AAA family ATPase [Flavobacterium undicola]MBA0882729.1 AAA family ATPase [Flavobacterium undicola]